MPSRFQMGTEVAKAERASGRHGDAGGLDIWVSSSGLTSSLNGCAIDSRHLRKKWGQKIEVRQHYSVRYSGIGIYYWFAYAIERRR